LAARRRPVLRTGEAATAVLREETVMAFDQWTNINPIPPKSFTCGHCNLMVGGNYGYRKKDVPSHCIYICPSCERPTYFDGDKQMPGVPFGSDVAALPPHVAGAYREARNCLAVSAFTASALMSRKLLMNIAVAQGDEAGRTFAAYIDYLADNGYVPPHGRSWVQHIRDKGNEATHEIPAISRSDAESLVTFVEMLLKFVYEFPSRVPPPS
jgi:Domain of unknown function (DUF4145)